jgi:hypothetical protein
MQTMNGGASDFFCAGFLKAFGDFSLLVYPEK